MHLGHHKALRTVTCATQVVPISYQGTSLQNIQIAHVAKCQKKKKKNSIKKQADINRHFSKEDIQMKIKHMKRGSTSLIIREMQIKTTMRSYFTPVWTAIITNSTNNNSWGKCWKKGTLLHCQWACKLVQPIWWTVWQLL